MTRRDLLDLIDRTRSDWERLLSDASVDDVQRPGVVGHWSAKDVLAHFVQLDRWMIVQLQSAFDGTTPTRRDVNGDVDYPPEFDTYLREDRRNRMIYVANKARPLETIVAEWRVVVASMVDLVSSRTDEELAEVVGLDPAAIGRRPRRGSVGFDTPVHRDMRRITEVPRVGWPQPVEDYLTSRVRHQADHLTDVRAAIQAPRRAGPFEEPRRGG